VYQCCTHSNMNAMNDKVSVPLWSHIGAIMRKVIPFGLRVEILRGRRFIDDIQYRTLISRKRTSREAFTHQLVEGSSPLRRPGTISSITLQKGKEHNVRLVAGAICGLVLQPGELFSYHALVGRPSRLRGFALGLELHDRQESAGIGGGSCQVSNLLYWLGIRAGFTIVERHRHAFDLFPDHCRTVPFGCGATVFFNYHDLRMQNPHKEAIRIGLKIEDGNLHGEICTKTDMGLSISIREVNHRFVKKPDGVVWRENEIHRTIRNKRGKLLRQEILAHNRGRVQYPVPDDLVELT